MPMPLHADATKAISRVTQHTRSFKELALGGGKDFQIRSRVQGTICASNGIGYSRKLFKLRDEYFERGDPASQEHSE